MAITNDFEKELKMGFLEEASQLLSEAEQCFLTLESKPSDVALLDKLFRLAHNLKGSSRAAGFTQVAEFTHELESLLLKLKNGGLPVNASIISLMLRCKDHLEGMVKALRVDLGASVDNGILLQELKAAQVAQPMPAPEKSDLAPRPPEEAPAEQASEEEAPQPLNLNEFQLPLPARLTKNPLQTSDESIRVSLARVERLVNFVGELVILQTILQQQKESQDTGLIGRTIDELSKVSKEIQSISMGLRMVPLKQTFQKMQRIVRDTSVALGKKVQLVIHGDETELDKTVLENLNDPLIHLINNAVDHGIEPDEKRLERGKPESGTIHLSAFQQADHIVIEVKDDGGGLDPEVLKKKAVEKGLIKAPEGLSEDEAYGLIFRPGFSTKTEVTDISGRGVGLDVVKTNIESILHGEVLVSSKHGVGTVFRIVLPLTLAIADGMIVSSADERYVIPLAQVHETIRPGEASVHRVAGIGEILDLRSESIPLYNLRDLLKRKPRKEPLAAPDCIAIIVRHAQKPFGILVDDIMGKQQVVIKPLGFEIRNIPGFSGSAILGDGCPGVILDLPTLVSLKSGQKGAIA